jgi:hypothetical protein
MAIAHYRGDGSNEHLHGVLTALVRRPGPIQMATSSGCGDPRHHAGFPARGSLPTSRHSSAPHRGAHSRARWVRSVIGPPTAGLRVLLLRVSPMTEFVNVRRLCVMRCYSGPTGTLNDTALISVDPSRMAPQSGLLLQAGDTTKLFALATAPNHDALVLGCRANVSRSTLWSPNLGPNP